MKALLFTSDPYEPSGVIGLYETEEQKQKIIKGYIDYMLALYPTLYSLDNIEELKEEASNLQEIEIPIGVYGQYY